MEGIIRFNAFHPNSLLNGVERDLKIPSKSRPKFIFRFLDYEKNVSTFDPANRLSRDYFNTGRVSEEFQELITTFPRRKLILKRWPGLFHGNEGQRCDGKLISEF